MYCNEAENCHLVCMNYFKTGAAVANHNCVLLDSKGKAIQVQAWGGPEGSRKLRLPDFKTIGI